MRKISIPFIVVSLLFMGFSIYGILKPKEEYLTTKGIIVEIEEDYDPIDDNTFYTTFIDYEVEDKKYSHVEYGAYNSKMNVGDEVTVYYIENNPSLIQAEGYQKVPYIVFFISLGFLAISIFMFVRNR